MLLPIFKSRRFLQSSPFLTGVRLERRILFSFLGNAVHQPPAFSMGLRQQLWAEHSQRNDSCIPARCQQHNARCDLDAELERAQGQVARLLAKLDEAERFKPDEAFQKKCGCCGENFNLEAPKGWNKQGLNDA